VEDVRAALFILIICMVSSTCYKPRISKYEGVGIITVIETKKTENGFDIIWEDSKQNEHLTFAYDTSIFKVGYKMKTLIKL